MRYIPNRETKKAVQNNRSNILSDFWSTFNMDLQDNPGAFRVANKLIPITTNENDSDLGLPVVFKAFDGYMWSIAGSKIFKNSGSNISEFTEDTSSGVPTSFDTQSDAENFNGELVVTTPTDIYTKVANASGTGAWTDRGNLTANGGYKKLCYFRRHNRIYFFDNADIKSMNTSYTIATTGDYYLSLSGYGILTTMEASSSSIWIGTAKSIGQSQGYTSGASIIEWDGISNDIVAEYRIPASGVLAMRIENDRPQIIDSNGIIREFSGSEFVEIGRLPLKKNQYLGEISVVTNTRAIHPRGFIETPDGTTLFMVCNRVYYQRGTTEIINENLPSGIWEWSRDNGVVHKHSVTHLGFEQNRITQAGALALAKYESTQAQSSIFCGAQYYTDASSTKYGIFIDAPSPSSNGYINEGQKSGYFVSAWDHASSYVDDFYELGTKFRKLLNSTDRILLKKRLEEVDPTEISITWGTVFSQTTSFTTTYNVSGLEGYEVEGIQGTGSGQTAHIKTITESGGTYTVLLDEALTGVTGTAKVRIQNWEKVLTVNTQNITHKFTRKSTIAERMQVKCCMRFTGDNEFYELGIINKPKIK